MVKKNDESTCILLIFSIFALFFDMVKKCFYCKSSDIVRNGFVLFFLSLNHFRIDAFLGK